MVSDLSPSFERVHAGVAACKLVNLLQGSLWQKARDQTKAKVYGKNKEIVHNSEN